MQGSMEEARQLFRNQETTEFIIVTIPTVMAMSESDRLAASLSKEGVPVRRIVVNQMVCFCVTWATEQCMHSARPRQRFQYFRHTGCFTDPLKISAYGWLYLLCA
jgi:arsenite/tail-anchored protein-transporting ATPase